MKLSVWAKQQGISYKTPWRTWQLGQLPVPVEQLPTGTLIVQPPSSLVEGGAALYAALHHLRGIEVVKEIGSGLNGHRRAMLKLLRNPVVHTKVV